ncbi:MAG: hypothetical protein G8237_01995 [Magnetococcales bacterium]|nr:hypothetical protein [Magnetococcales bacterium]NGZ05105.1 hypothetical protein [Magnetococcales bacterium]
MADLKKPISKVSLVIRMRDEGRGLRATGRVVGSHKNTIYDLRVKEALCWSKRDFDVVRPMPKRRKGCKGRWMFIRQVIFFFVVIGQQVRFQQSTWDSEGASDGGSDPADEKSNLIMG